MKTWLIKILIKLMVGLYRYFPFGFEFVLKVSNFILKDILKYRKSVVQGNLENSLSNFYPASKIDEIVNMYYDTLMRYIKEIIIMSSFDVEKVMTKMVYKNKDIWENYFNGKRSIIVTASHHGNWEVNMVALPALTRMKVVAFYKPISDAETEKIMLEIRSRFGLLLYPINQTPRIINELKMEKVLYIFLGDQSPLNMNGVYWNSFLNQRTPWMTGAEKIAKKYNYPVVYLHQYPVLSNDNWYELNFELISENPRESNDGEITEKYSRILEEEILTSPQYWLWSHKRWKRAHVSD